jgi:regulator of protease activity HflC (stomatin/prohibitin superfamily)
LHRTVGPEWFNTVVAPRVAQIFKAQTIKYDTVSVLPNRETIREDTARILKDQLKEYSIGDIDFLIKNIGFGKEYQEEIEATAAAVQAAQRESAKVEQEKQKAFALIEKAKGEAGAVTALATAQAEANKKLSDSITPTLVQYEMVRKLSDKVQVMMIPTGQQFIMPAELLKPTQTAR